jgi:uncharacterized protein YdeI (YjbR/CyaY-like superfamily)
LEQTKNLCAQIPVELHTRVRQEQEKSGQSLSAYITEVLTQYYQGGTRNMENTRTMAFQIPEDLFQRLKDYLALESERTGRKLSQKEFVLGLIQQALDEAGI